MSDYAGAIAAIRQRLVDNWTATPITFENEPAPQPWPPTEPDPDAPSFPRPAPWVHLEISGTGADAWGVGRKGNRPVVQYGLIEVHVFVPISSGTDLATSHAVALADLFASEVFYQDDPDMHVRTGIGTQDGTAPRISGADSADHEGNWYRVTMTCPFEFWGRG